MALRSTAAVFTYARSRGLFAGISVEGSYLIERKETNRKYGELCPPRLKLSYCRLFQTIQLSLCRGCRFYSRDIRASAILNGDVEPPSECYDLYRILEDYTEAYNNDWTAKNMQTKVGTPKASVIEEGQHRAESAVRLVEHMDASATQRCHRSCSV